MRERLEVLQTGIHHEHTGDTRDEEVFEEEEETTAETPEVKILKSIFGAGSSSKDDVPFYSGNLDLEELIDWIIAMNKHFDYAEVKEDRQVRFVVTKWRWHASLWWDGVQEERILKHKAKINSWSRMTAKLKGKFIPKDYTLILLRKMKNIRQKSMTVREYTEEFYKVNIRYGHIEDTPERVSRYVNGLRSNIQDELSLLS